MKEKTCPKCLATLPATVEHFRPRPKHPSGIDYACRKCVAAAERARSGTTPVPPLEIRFWRLVNRLGPEPGHVPGIGNCWVWTGPKFHDGYGQLRGFGKLRRAHRLSWRMHFGEWPELQVLHRCDNRLCVRPAHLFLGTPGDNVHDCVAKGRARGGVLYGRARKTAKLDDDLIPIIRASAGHAKHVAAAFGVTTTTIYAIRNGQAWRHVPGKII